MTSSDNRTQTLAEILASSARGVVPVRLPHSGDLIGIIMGYRSEDSIDLVVGSDVRTFEASCPAVPINEDEAKHRLLVDAAGRLNLMRHQLAAEQADDEHAHQSTLQQIRSYAIDRYVYDSQYSLIHLNAFLREFDLGEYRPRVQVTLAIDVFEALDNSEGSTRTDAGPISLDISAYQRVTRAGGRTYVEVDSVRVLPETNADATSAPTLTPLAGVAAPEWLAPMRTVMVATGNPNLLTAATVLSVVDSEWIEVVSGAGLIRISRSAVTNEFLAPEVRMPALADALATLVWLHGQAKQRRQEWLAARDHTMAEIRRYVIDRQDEGLYCLEGLNTFLHTFGLREHDASSD
jgi:hypothetical protein